MKYHCQCSVSLLFLILMISCSTGTNEEVRNEAIQSAKINSLTKPIQFDTLVDFTVISLINTSDYPSSANETLMCVDWSLSKEQVKSIIQSAQLIDGHQWHYLFSHLPCQAKGQITQNQQTFEFAINGGSWMTIGNSDSTIMLGLFDKKYDSLFLDGAWEEADEY